jgi:Kef-type K+ transport system membrane component KefB
MNMSAASATHQTERVLAMTLLQLTVILLSARVMHVLARRVGQPGVVGEILAGLMLGPCVLGALCPGFVQSLFGATPPLPMTILSQIGLILLMFQIGTEFRLDLLRGARDRRAVVGVALASVTVPLLTGLATGWMSAEALAPKVNPLAYSLFVGTALAITAVPVLGRILRELDLGRTQVGAVSLAAAAINDVVGWSLLAGISAFTTASFSWLQTGLQLGGIVALFVFAITAGRPLCAALVRRLPPSEGELSPNLLVIALAVVFCAGIATYELGVFVIFGGFLVGVLFHDQSSLVKAWDHQVGRFVEVFFLPIFFTLSGLRADISGFSSGHEWVWFGVLLACAVASKTLPAYLAARAFGLAQRDAASVGVLMNTRGLMELIVLNVGYDLGVLPKNAFSMLTIVAILTNLMTTPLLRWLRGRRAVSPLATAKA